MIERVLAVPRPAIERHLRQGFLDAGSADLMEALGESSVFLNRPAAEADPTHKQVIPYIVITHRDQFLLYRRTKKQGESRLHDKFSLGFGGHINDIDGQSGAKTNLIMAAMVRELNEEVFIPSIRRLSVVGFINDDASPVGQVHLGVAFLVEAGSGRFAVNEPEMIEAMWSDAAGIEEVFPKLESWSQLLWTEYLKARPQAAGQEAPGLGGRASSVA
ncbi:MAG TPA: NUDIX domain-containing protein [Opitutaceae bacterium]|jgi:predicted NUDIX family phosphoesterase